MREALARQKGYLLVMGRLWEREDGPGGGDKLKRVFETHRKEAAKALDEFFTAEETAKIKAWEDRLRAAARARLRAMHKPRPAGPTVEPDRTVAVPPDTIAKLGLSDAQAEELEKFEAELAERVEKAEKAGDADALKEAYRWFRRRLYETLTEDQRVRWEAIARESADAK